MKAAVIFTAGKPPVFADFETPVAQKDEELISVRASALSQFTKSRASGAHYSASHALPAIAGSDGVGLTQDDRRVYFILPPAPFGAMAELTRAATKNCIEVPPTLDDITAAAIANPGMSAWAALVNRAQIKQGETVLINGATGIAGRLAVQLAKYLGAAKVIATGRDRAALAQVKALGADVVIPFDLPQANPEDAEDFKAALADQLGQGIDIVVDYLWGRSAEIILASIARTLEDTTPVRFVHVGASSGSDIVLPGAVLRSSAVQLMGSGIKSVALADLLAAVGYVFAAVAPAKLQIATQAIPLSEVAASWDALSGKSRVVFTIG